MSIVVQNIHKSFAGSKALDDVTFSIHPGRIHMLLGANGSGKSTLVKILTGVYQPDGGSLIIGGTEVRSVSSPHEARKYGIRVVHQEAPLIDSMTVAECVALFRGYPAGLWGIRWNALLKDVSALFDRLQLPIDPTAIAGKLSAAQRAMVALAIALDGAEADTKLLILDEADATIPEAETGYFLERVKHIASTGIPVLMVTHRLKQVGQMGDDATIFANGKMVYSGPSQALTEMDMIAKMTGRPADERAETPVSADGIPLGLLWRDSGRAEPQWKAVPFSLEVSGLRGDAVKDVALRIKPGEIVGIAGTADAGVNELPLLLSGAKPAAAGEIKVQGRQLPGKATPRDMIRNGIVLVPADRLRQGGSPRQTVEENVILPDAFRYWHKRKRLAATVERLMQILNVQPRDRHKRFGTLSGGNQQKVILGKWLLLMPSVLILDDPTQGVDPGARQKIYEAMKEAAQYGVSILLFTTEPEQFSLLCDKVLVLREGKIALQLNREDGSLTREAVMRWCYA